jgi:hypothetical protein
MGKIRTYQYEEGLEMFYNGEVLGEAVYWRSLQP